MSDHKGFTLIELMVVITIIGILAAIAIPSFNTYREKAYLAEGLSLVQPVIRNTAEFYGHRGFFPTDNRACGVADPMDMKGKYVQSIHIDNGAITIRFNEAAGSKSGGAIILTPEVDMQEPSGIIAWQREDDFEDSQK